MVDLEWWSRSIPKVAGDMLGKWSDSARGRERNGAVEFESRT